jgi:hypothetical protein
VKFFAAVRSRFFQGSAVAAKLPVTFNMEPHKRNASRCLNNNVLASRSGVSPEKFAPLCDDTRRAQHCDGTVRS